MTMTRDEAIAFVQEWNRHYNGGEVDEPEIHDGISFWRVGHNASHDFNAGVGEDGRLYSYSAGEDSREEAEYQRLRPRLRKLPEAERSRELKQFSERVRRRNTRLVESFDGYYGHF